MKSDVYGAAYQAAKSELLDITCRFEQLRLRKERLEGVVMALGPMLGVTVALPSASEAAPELVVPSAAAPRAAEATETPAYTFNQVVAPAEDSAEVSADPFERRVRNALKFGGPRREGLQQAV